MVENEGFRANGHQIRILLIEIYLYANFQPKRTQPAHVFNNFSVSWCVTFLFFVVFFYFFPLADQIFDYQMIPHIKRLRMHKKSRQTDEFSVLLYPKNCGGPLVEP